MNEYICYHLTLLNQWTLIENRDNHVKCLTTFMVVRCNQAKCLGGVAVTR